MIANVNPAIFVILGIATTSLAQIVLKMGSGFEVLSKKWIVVLIISLIVYSIAFLSYYVALRYFDISKISPIMMVSTVTLISVYGFVVGESFNYCKLFGIALAALSIFLIARS